MELEGLARRSPCPDDGKEEAVVDEEPEPRLPGFRFHPTDEELVNFYLKRKVEKRPISIEIIKEIDIYKHDPWDLAKGSSVGDKEWYYYCKRERKYRNSVRPNRVTGSGFWKATGIDKPIYSSRGEGHHESTCVGLKKSLVYYRGSAGKGSKTQWMMHEFRLPTHQQHSFAPSHVPSCTNALQEAEVWTLCRIFRRSQKNAPNWRHVLATNVAKTPSSESINSRERYISFANATIQQQQQQQHNYLYEASKTDCVKNANLARQISVDIHTSASEWSPSLNPTSQGDGGHEFIGAYDGNWDDLSSVVEFAVRPPLV